MSLLNLVSHCLLPLFQLVCRLLERNISALLAAVDADSFDTIYSYSNTFNVPFITPWFPEKVRVWARLEKFLIEKKTPCVGF